MNWLSARPVQGQNTSLVRSSRKPQGPFLNGTFSLQNGLTCRGKLVNTEGKASGWWGKLLPCQPLPLPPKVRDIFQANTTS